MKIKKTYFITNKIKKAWIDMERNCNVTPFLYYNYMKNVIWNAYLRLSIPVYYYAENDNGEICMIAPMKYNVKNAYYDTLGNIGFCDVTDLLFSPDIAYEEKVKILTLLKSRIGKNFYLSRLDSSSETLQIYKNCSQTIHIHNCVDIEIGNNHESYFCSLSKSVRQNIRTAYNRLNRDGIKFKLLCIIGGGICLNL